MPKRNPGPSIKDKKVYEALRDEGNSKEKSARIANAAAARGRTAVARKGGKAPSYEEWTVTALRDRARTLDISGRSQMKKSQLIDAIRHH